MYKIRNVKMIKKILIPAVLVLFACALFFLFRHSKTSKSETSKIENFKSPKIEKLIEEKCHIVYGTTASPGNIFGIIKLINDKWVVILVRSSASGTYSNSYSEYWISTSKIISISKYHLVK